jgi:hypothetical protein
MAPHLETIDVPDGVEDAAADALPGGGRVTPTAGSPQTGQADPRMARRPIGETLESGTPTASRWPQPQGRRAPSTGGHPCTGGSGPAPSAPGPSGVLSPVARRAAR